MILRLQHLRDCNFKSITLCISLLCSFKKEGRAVTTCSPCSFLLGERVPMFKIALRSSLYDRLSLLGGDAVRPVMFSFYCNFSKLPHYFTRKRPSKSDVHDVYRKFRSSINTCDLFALQKPNIICL